MRIIKIIIIIFFTSKSLMAGIGSSSMQFLKLSPSPRASSMAESIVSVDGEVDNIFYNPAGVWSHFFMDTSISYTKWFQNLNFINFAGKVIIGDIGDIGIGFFSILYDDLFKVEEENGVLVQSDERVDLASYLATLNFSRMFMNSIILGLNIKIANELIDESLPSNRPEG